MKIIYYSFLKKRNTKKFIMIFWVICTAIIILSIFKTILVKNGNEAYSNSFLYLFTKEEINFENKNIKEYEILYEVNCNTTLTKILVSNKDIIHNNYYHYNKCTINNNTLSYSTEDTINIIKNESLYNELKQQSDGFYYIIKLKNWMNLEKTYKDLINRYKVDIEVKENRIDDVEYRSIIKIFNIFIIILTILFLIILLISILNIIEDEKQNNFLYKSLGYSRIKIIDILLKKILIVVSLPLLIIIIVCLLL